MERGSYTLHEILSQPKIWQQALAVYQKKAQDVRGFWQENMPGEVVFTGCGSTYYLSLIAAALYQSINHQPAVARPASELLLFPELVFAAPRKRVLVAISRSGTTSETVAAVRKFKQAGGKVLAITCDSSSTLALEADCSINNDAAKEDSVAQTRSFASMLLTAEALAAARADLPLDVLQTLPARLEAVLAQYTPLAKKYGEDLGSIERFFFLGSGPFYGLACEAMLKMKEMSLSYSEAFHMLEFRHGPMSMVNEKTLVVGLVSEAVRPYEVAVLEQMKSMGATILPLVTRADAVTQALGPCVEVGEGMPEWAREVLYLPVLQLLAYHRSMAKGLNPDRPTNLTAVVELENL